MIENGGTSAIPHISKKPLDILIEKLGKPTKR